MPANPGAAADVAHIINNIQRQILWQQREAEVYRRMEKMEDKPREDVTIIWGGHDVDPAVYGMEKQPMCGGTNRVRDDEELALIKQSWKEGKAVIGVCRGAQLLNVANGGILIQHLNGHTNSHHAKTQVRVENFYEGYLLTVTSTHHQAMVPTKEAVQLLLSDQEVTGNDPLEGIPTTFKYVNEVVFYPKTRSLCIQPHPEFMNERDLFVKWIDLVVEEYLNILKIDWWNSSSGDW